jgi:hypothetical protein
MQIQSDVAFLLAAPISTGGIWSDTTWRQEDSITASRGAILCWSQSVMVFHFIISLV